MAHREPFLTTLMKVMTLLGEGGAVWIALGLIFLLKKQTRRVGISILLALLLSVIFCNGILKNVVARPRPCWRNPDMLLLERMPMDYSFPSGHSASSFAAAVSIFFRSRRGGAAAICLAALIAISRLYFYVHYPTDILAGTLLGILLAVMAEYLLRITEKKGMWKGRIGD